MGFLDFLKPKKSIARGYLSTYDQQVIKTKWGQVEELLISDSPSARRSAVLEADKILDYALDRLFPGLTSTGERLKLAKEYFRGHYEDYDKLWFAHKVRNEMVHNINFEMPSVEAKNTTEKFRIGLQALGAML